MSGLHETGITTGTRDKDYDLVSYVQACLENALRMGVYRRDAERDQDAELVELFSKAQADSRKGAEIGKKLLAARLAGNGAAAGTPGTGHAAPTDVMAPGQSAPEQSGMRGPA